MHVTTSDFTSPSVHSYNITVNDGETTFTQRFGVAVTGGTTGINEVRSNTEEVRAVFYNLQGLRLAQPRKGLNIVRSAEGRTQGKNGCKVIIK
jgi:hypothetical protein